MSGMGPSPSRARSTSPCPRNAPAMTSSFLMRMSDTARLQLGTGRGDQRGVSCDVHSQSDAGIEPEAVCLRCKSSGPQESESDGRRGSRRPRRCHSGEVLHSVHAAVIVNHEPSGRPSWTQKRVGPVHLLPSRAPSGRGSAATPEPDRPLSQRPTGRSSPVSHPPRVRLLSFRSIHNESAQLRSG